MPVDYNLSNSISPETKMISSYESQTILVEEVSLHVIPLDSVSIVSQNESCHVNTNTYNMVIRLKAGIKKPRVLFV